MVRHSEMEIQTVTYSEDSSSVLRGFTPPTIPKTVPLGTEISSQFSGSDSPIDDFLVDASRVRALLGVRTVFLGSANELSFPVQEFDPGSLSRAPDIVECLLVTAVDMHNRATLLEFQGVKRDIMV